MRHLTATLLLAAVLVASCSKATDDETPLDIAGDWMLVTGTLDGSPIPVVDGYRITLFSDGAEVAGTAACNGYGGVVQADGSSVAVGELVHTEMACEPPEVMASEQGYLEALSRVETGARSDGELVLTGTGVELRFATVAPVDDEALVDTVWLLDTLVEQDMAFTPSGDPATLELRSDGTLVGTTGCRTLTGTYVLEGDMVAVTALSADGDCPAELNDQDALVVAVIGDGFIPEIDGDALAMSSRGGLGLVYRAASP